MKITSIETFSNHQICFVRVKADNGGEGFGQTAPFHANITALVLHQQMAQYFIGAELNEPSDIAELAEKSIIAQYKFPWSYICRAVAGIETALWDLFGKLSGQPVYQLLGGTFRPIPVYGSSMSRSISPNDESIRMKKLKEEQGFRAFKFRIGDGVGKNADVFTGRTEQIIESVRKAVGSNTYLCADANGAYTPEKAIEIGRLLESFGVLHYEEPCPFNELEWTKQVSETLTVQVTGGEQDNDMAQWRRMIDMRAVDTVQPDVCYIGGISRTLKIADMARKAGMVCTPHSANLTMIPVFTSHLLMAIPNSGPFMELSIDDNFSQELFMETFQVCDGTFNVPIGSGWGLTIRPEWLSKSEYNISRAKNIE